MLGLRSTAVCAIASLFALDLTLAQEPPAQVRPPSYVNTTEVISVPTTVLTSNGRFVRGLKQEDFELLEDGVPQELTTFKNQSTSPIRAVLLLDVSGSMNLVLDQVKRAAMQFVRFVTPNDLVKVFQFDDSVTPLIDFDSDRKRLEQAIQSMKSRRGATALHDAIYRGLAELEARAEEDREAQRNRAIIVLTDGEDTVSALKANEVLQRARRTSELGPIVYALSLDRNNGRAVTDGPAASLLREITHLTGGNLEFPDLTSLTRHYEDLAGQLRQQYVLGYVSSNKTKPPGWRSVIVNVKNRRNLVLRFRQGYHSSEAGR